MESNLRMVRPVPTPAPYIGGKRNLAGRLVPMIEAVPHRIYAEPFVGMGGVFLRRTQVPQVEVINDYSRCVATFFRILQRHYPQFLEVMKFQLTSRSEFERLCRVDPETLTDLERSARFLYLQRLAFGGKVQGRSFGVDVARGARFDITRLTPILEAIHERLAGVVIECLGFEAFIRRYDRAETLFYLDPPYWDCETDYGKTAFRREDFTLLAALLGTIQGRFILSINDRPAVRELFAAFRIIPVTTTYGIQGGAAPAAELIITNT